LSRRPTGRHCRKSVRLVNADWIAEGGDLGWIGLRKDANILRRAEEIAAVDAYDLRMLVILMRA
jgi:hypothetical protein